MDDVRMELRVARIRRKMTQRQLAVAVGASQQTVAKWELGVTTPSHFATIRELEKILGEPAEELFPDIFG